MAEDDEIEALRQKTERGDRLGEQGDDGGSDFDLAAAVRAELEAQDDKSVSVWDAPVSAYVEVLRAHEDEREAVARALGIADPEDAERSDVLRAALRNGLHEADPERWGAVQEAVAEFETGSL